MDMIECISKSGFGGDRHWVANHQTFAEAMSAQSRLMLKSSKIIRIGLQVNGLRVILTDCERTVIVDSSSMISIKITCCVFVTDYFIV